MDKENLKDYYDNLLKNVISLYTRSTLQQYHLSEEQALEIVSNVTKIPKEKLQELKNKREEGIKEEFKNSQESIVTAASR